MLAMRQTKATKTLPIPTTIQKRAFAAHLAWAHSWYKHLPLDRGGQFIIFLSEDAGTGFSNKRPRLHNGWKTTNEYRKRYGYLDYAYRIDPEAAFIRDTPRGLPQELSQDYLDAATFILYPFVSTNFSAMDTLYGLHGATINKLKDGAEHPLREGILYWHSAYEHYQASFGDLSEVEYLSVLEISDLAPKKHNMAPRVRDHLHWELISHLAYDALQETQYHRIGRAIDAACDWYAQEA